MDRSQTEPKVPVRKQAVEGDKKVRGWRDGSVVKSTGYSCRGPGFDSQQPHGSSQFPIIPIPRHQKMYVVNSLVSLKDHKVRSSIESAKVFRLCTNSRVTGLPGFLA